jgi:repressor LexA
MRTPDKGRPEPAGIGRPRERILAAIDRFNDLRGYPPGVRDISRLVKLAPSTVDHHLKVLVRLGLVIREQHGPRTVRFRTRRRPGPGSSVTFWLRGTVAAGVPNSSDEVLDEELTLPSSLVGSGGELFALRVHGDSMIEAAICEGDIVVVRRQDAADSGDIVAALVDGEATVKMLRVRDGRVELVPRNPYFDVISGEHATIMGKVVCVMRRL